MEFDKKARIAAAMMLLASMTYPQTTWHDLKNRRGANFYAVKKSFALEKSAEEEARAHDLTALLNPVNPYSEGEEEENDIHFHRWANYVEPRVASAAGDLSVLEIGQQVIANLVLGRTALGKGSASASAGQWQSLGPIATNTGGAGRLNWVAFHPTDTNSYMVGSPSGGLWFTRDRGATWSTPTDKIAVLGAAWAAYHPSNPNIIYLGTGDGDKGDTKSIGLLKSIDGGATWATTGLTYAIADDMQITKIAVDPRDGNKIFVATTWGVQYSTDGGISFRASVGIVPSYMSDIEIHPTNSNIVYASADYLYRSTDGGVTFILNTSLPPSGRRIQLAVTPAQPNYVYALRGAWSATQGVSRSIDSGLTFTQTGTGSAIGCSQVWYDYGFGANPLNANEIMAGCVNAFRSTNGGATWSSVGSNYHVDVHAIEYNSKGASFLATDGGLWRNAGSGSNTWTNLNNNLNIGQSYRIGVHRTDYDQVCTGRQDNGTDVRGVQTGAFRAALGGDGMECFFNLAGTRFYGETQNGGFIRCTYANGAVSQCFNIITGLPVGPWETPWLGDPNNGNVLFTGRNGQVWRSANEGAGWAQWGTVGDTGNIWNMAVAPSNSNVLYLVKGAGIFKTVNGGGTWVKITGAVTGTPYAVAVAATDPNDVWVTVSGYSDSSKVWHSVDGGTIWNNETFTGLPNLPANSLAIDDAAGQHAVYLAMDIGVYYKQDGMSAWQDFTGGLPNAGVRELQIANKSGNTADRFITAATYGRGVWRSTPWNQPTPAWQASEPRLRNFTAAMSGLKLRLRFQLGGERFDNGLSTLQLTGLDGKIIYEERVPGFGVYDKIIDLSRHGKGLYVFTVRNGDRRLSKRVFAMN